MRGTYWGHTGQMQLMLSVTLIQACPGQPSSPLLENLRPFLGQKAQGTGPVGFSSRPLRCK